MSSAFLSRRGVLLGVSLTGCWTFWSIAGALVWSLKAPKNLPFILHYTLVDGSIGLVACGLLFVAYGHLRTVLELRGFLGLLLPLCFVGAIAWHASSSLTMWVLGWQDRHNLNAFSLLVGGGVNDGITLALFALLFLAVDHWTQLRDEQERAREAAAAANAGIADIQLVVPNRHYELAGYEFDTLPAYFTDAKANHPQTAEWVGYVLALNGHRYYVTGDTQPLDQMSEAKADVVFPLLAGCGGNMGQALKISQITGAKVVVPVHHSGQVATIKKFLTQLPEATGFAYYIDGAPTTAL